MGCPAGIRFEYWGQNLCGRVCASGVQAQAAERRQVGVAGGRGERGTGGRAGSGGFITGLMGTSGCVVLVLGSAGCQGR